jgi:hypothetical protein
VRGSRTEKLAEIAIADTGIAVEARGETEIDEETAVMIVAVIAIAIVIDVIADTTMIGTGLVVGNKIGIEITRIVIVGIGIALRLGITIVPTEDGLVRAREKDLIVKMTSVINTDEQTAATPPPSDESTLSDAETKCTNDYQKATTTKSYYSKKLLQQKATTTKSYYNKPTMYNPIKFLSIPISSNGAPGSAICPIYVTNTKKIKLNQINQINQIKSSLTALHACKRSSSVSVSAIAS